MLRSVSSFSCSSFSSSSSSFAICVYRVCLLLLLLHMERLQGRLSQLEERISSIGPIRRKIETLVASPPASTVKDPPHVPEDASQVEDGRPSIVEVLYDENTQLKVWISSLEALVPKGLGAYSALIKDAMLAQQDANQARELADSQMQQATIALSNCLYRARREPRERRVTAADAPVEVPYMCRQASHCPNPTPKGPVLST